MKTVDGGTLEKKREGKRREEKKGKKVAGKLKKWRQKNGGKSARLKTFLPANQRLFILKSSGTVK